MINGKNISLKIKNKKILDDINFEILPNRITSFIGKNGSGKTTLLHCILNLQKKYSGTILFENDDLKKIKNIVQAKLISFVFQEHHLFNNLNVLQNCLIPIKNIYKLTNSDAQKKVEEILNRFQIYDLANSYPSKLSHGQKQKVAIARALSLDPKILILDEPTASLDIESTKNLANLLLELNNNGLTLLLTSHDQFFIDLMFDRYYQLENGKIINFFEKK